MTKAHRRIISGSSNGAADLKSEKTHQVFRPVGLPMSDCRRIGDLIVMLSYRRPYLSVTEQAFIREWIIPLGAKPDAFGNYLLRIGDAPILWSSHTDTVHNQEGYQKLHVTATGVASLHPDNLFSSCLGADDTTGVWIMREMIRAEVPGLYIFHRGEEKGGKGSHWIAKNTPEILKGIKVAIAFDRMNYGDVIISQGGGTTASHQFAYDMSDLLGNWWKPSPGVYTDTTEYAEIVPECSNLSVGYFNQHCTNEWQDLCFASYLRDKMVTVSVDEIIKMATRTPKPRYESYPYYAGKYGYGGYNGYKDKDYDYTTYSTGKKNSENALANAQGTGRGYEEEDDDLYWERHEARGKDDEETFHRLVERYPRCAVSLLMAYGISINDLKEVIMEELGLQNVWD